MKITEYKLSEHKGAGYKLKGYRLALGLCLCIVCFMAGGEAVLGAQEGDLQILQELKEEELEDIQPPEKVYTDEEGRRYQLDTWDIRQIPGEYKSQEMEQILLYEQVEGAQELPGYAAAEGAENLPEYAAIEGAENLPEYAASEGAEKSTGSAEASEARGRLPLERVRVVGEVWQEGFEMPVTFHSYGADGYQLGEIIIEGEDILGQAAAAGEILLESQGLSAEDYKIRELVWDGEAFLDEGGQLCRRAVALGEKCLRDYEALYRGEIRWKEPDTYELRARYSPEALPELSGEQSEIPSEILPGEPEPVSEEPGTWWQRIRRGAALVIGLGFPALVAAYFIIGLVLMKKKKDRNLRRRGITDLGPYTVPDEEIIVD